MNGDVIAVKFTDPSGAEWQDLLVTLVTETASLTTLNTAIAALPSASSIATAGLGRSGPNADRRDYYGCRRVGLCHANADQLWAGGATAQEVWGYGTRSLTLDGGASGRGSRRERVVVTSGVTFAGTISNLTIPTTWTKVYLTAKTSAQQDDSIALLQIVESNPGAVTDGLLYVNGAAGTAAWGRTDRQSGGRGRCITITRRRHGTIDAA